MTDYMRKHTGRECPPPPEHPADQPKPPGDGTGCEEYPPTAPPDLKPPTPCPPPDPCCNCHTPPGSTPNCLEELIAQQTADTAALQQENLFTQELNALLATAKNARTAYTRDKYLELVEKWEKEDIDIAELVRRLVCSVPCWRCILDCYVCPLLNELHTDKKWLYDDAKLITNVNDLYDLQYWLTRDRGVKDRRLKRIKDVLGAWNAPATTIEKALNDNRSLIDSLGPFIGPHPGRAIYDVFLVLIPRHLAIAPPVLATPEPTTPSPTTLIDKKYTEFCPCDDGKHDDCCGPDVGELSFRERLVEPMAYLINPDKYYDLICCLVEKRYVPAKDALSQADAELGKVNDRITRYEKAIGEGWKSEFERNARAAIPSDINCCDYENHKEGCGHGPQQQSSLR